MKHKESASASLETLRQKIVHLFAFCGAHFLKFKGNSGVTPTTTYSCSFSINRLAVIWSLLTYVTEQVNINDAVRLIPRKRLN